MGRRSEEPLGLESVLLGDASMQAYSGMTVPTLRVMQSAGALKAQKIPRENGGYQRFWIFPEMLKAAIGVALVRHFGWNIRTVATAMGGPNVDRWDMAAMYSLKGDMSLIDRGDGAILATSGDLYAELIDRRFLFLQPPREISSRVKLPYADMGLFLGVVDKRKFYYPGCVSAIEGRLMLHRSAKEKHQAPREIERLAMATQANFESKSVVNVSMPVRAAWCRAYSREPRFVQGRLEEGRR